MTGDLFDELRSANPVQVNECEHWSATGVDDTPIEDPDKVWRCDGCGWLYRSAQVEGQPPFVRVMRGVRE